MIEQQVTELGMLLEILGRPGHPLEAEQLGQVALSLAKVFGVDADEVAVLGVDPKERFLKFIIPEKLASIGTIPLSSNHALAARTARERRAELLNNFTASRHATVFEGVPLGRRQGQLIHKMMSAPILDGTRIAGVVQISRKGHSKTDSGPDFTQKDLRTLTSLSPALIQFLKLCQVG
jgi:GAF domain-containing protein